MDNDFLDDLLFDGISSQEDFDLDADLSDGSDSELLFADSDDEPALWDIEGVPVEAPINDIPCGRTTIARDCDLTPLRSTNAIGAPNQPTLHDR